MNSTTPVAVQTVSNWIIVSQVKSNRVVYFTDDANYQPPMEGDWYYCSSYQGSLPPAMTLRNCWGWRFNGSVFSDAREAPKKSTQELLIDNNRKALLRILRDKIDAIRAPFLPSCSAGEQVRQIKLVQAQRYLSGELSGENQGDYAQLQAVAVARNISLHSAAQLVVAKAAAMEQVLLESERFREQLTQAIESAQTQAQLHSLRTWLLDKVYPELTEQFKFHLADTQPPMLDKPLSDTQRIHEIARLKMQLRTLINQQRSQLHSDYIQNEEMRKYKLRLAQAWLQRQASEDGEPENAIDYSLLEDYANAHQVDRTQAAQLMVEASAHAGQLLLRTEKLKDRMLARIEALQTLADLKEIEDELKSATLDGVADTK